MASNPPIVSSELIATPSAAPSNKKAMFIVFLVVVVDLLGFSIVLPLLPITGKEYLEPLFSGEHRELWVGVTTGLLIASFSAMQFLVAPSWGRLSDRIGRRVVLLVGLFASVLFYGLFGYAAGLPVQTQATIAIVLMFVARIGAGIAGATISTAQAVIADSTTPEKRKHGMALIGAAFGVAFTFGPLLGALAMRISSDPRSATSLTGYVAATLSAMALLLAFFLLPETRSVVGNSGPATTRKRVIELSAWRWALTTTALAPVILIFFLASMGFGSLETTISLLLEYLFDMKPGDSKDRLYWWFAYTGFVLVLTQGVLYRRLAKKLNEVTLMIAGIVFMALGVLLLGGVSFAKSLGSIDFLLLKAALIIAFAVAVIGFAFLTPSAQALISRRAPPDRQGEILGVNQSAAALARILGPIFGISLFSATKTHMLPYLFGAGLLLLMLPLMPRVKKG